MPAKKRKALSTEYKNRAELQLKELQRSVEYDTKDYTVELIISKFKKGDFFVPDYQREFIWAEKNKTSFIESVLLGLPIPFMFLGDCEDGRLEIIDGVQRINSLVAFSDDQLELTGLPKLTDLAGFTFSNLSETQQRRFNNRTLRIVVLNHKTPKELRPDIFSRINRTGKKVNDSEFRRGTYPGPLTKFIEKCAKDQLFIRLCPVSKIQEKRYERFELVLRFFAYMTDYESFDHHVAPFLDSFLVTHQNNFDAKKYFEEFKKTCEFVEKHFQYGFAKTATAMTTPRVRFEAISVGVALALRKNSCLTVRSVNWLYSPEFDELTTSDASNNQGKLRKRIEYVRNQLLKDFSHV